MKTRENRARVRAFTLLELLMVVVIIGLLAAFVVPNFIGTGDRVKVDLTQAAIDGSLTTALKMYHAHMGKYPTTEEGLKVLVYPPDDADLAKKWVKCLDDPKGLKDQWGHEYHYVCPGEYNKDGFDLSSDGQDGEQGTADDIRNWQQG